MHCDTPYECFVKKEDFFKNSLAVSGEQGEHFEKWCQTFAVWIKDDMPKPFDFYRSVITDFKQKLKEKPTNLTPIFSVEGGALLEDDAERLHILKEDGIAFLTLCWNGENAIAGGCKSDKDLTDFGKNVIGIMNRLKIGCDLSHLNEKSFYSAIEYAEYPLATHSNCFSVCNDSRNLTDQQLQLLAEKDGIVGLCFYPSFLGRDVLDAIWKNIYHLCEMGMENNIAIGSDFDGGEMDDCLKNLNDISHLYRFLEQKGLQKKLLDKIFYNNANKYIAKLNKKD